MTVTPFALRRVTVNVTVKLVRISMDRIGRRWNRKRPEPLYSLEVTGLYRTSVEVLVVVMGRIELPTYGL